MQHPRRLATVLLGLLIPCSATAQQPLAETALLHAGIFMSILAQDRPGSELPPHFAFRHFEALELTEGQGTRMRELRARAEGMFLGMASVGWPSPAVVLQLWSGEHVDDADLWLASQQLAERERRLVLGLIEIRQNVLEVLSPRQQERFRQLEAERSASQRTDDRGAVTDVAAITAAIDHEQIALVMPHPLWVARRHADRLGLGTAERSALDRLHQALAAQLASAVPDTPPAAPDIMTLPLAEAEALLATLHDDTRLEIARSLLQARDAAFAAVGADRRDALVALMREALESQMATQPTRIRECRQGASGGSFRYSESARVRYSARFQGDTAELGFLIIGLGADDGAPARSRPELPADVFVTGGGTVGGWFVEYEPARRRIWIHGEPVDIGDANVVILTDVNRLRERPTIAALHRIDSLVPTDGCAGTNFTDVLRAWLEGVESLRPYLRN